MRIQLLSSLHHEFSHVSVPETNAHVVVLAGDIDTGVRGVEWAKKLRKPVIYVRGNHEPYRHDIEKNLKELRACAANSQVHILERDEINLNGVRFLGCTLWTDFSLFGENLAGVAMAQAEQHLNDFSVIEYRGAHLTPEITRQWHRDSVEWLDTKLSKPFDGKTVVVTHHAPHPRCVHPRYAHDILSASLSSNLEHLMGRANVWIFGESRGTVDLDIKGTRVLANPRGFSWFENGAENGQFRPDMVISLTNTGHTTGTQLALTNHGAQVKLLDTQVSDIEVRHPSGGADSIKGIFVDDFPSEVHKDLLRMIERTRIQRDKDGRLFVDAAGWDTLLSRLDLVS